MSLGESSDPHLVPVTPVDAVHAADVKQIRAREEEEEFARQHSMPTRLLGWMLIAGVILQFLGGLMRSHADLGGLIFLFAGFMVKSGSQAALRFVIFSTIGSFLAIPSLIWDAFHAIPLKIGTDAYFPDDFEFWTLGVSPLVYILAESVLGIVVLRTRRLPFWTKTVRGWTYFCVFVLLIASVFAVREWRRTMAIEQEIPAEIAAARAYIASSTPSVITSTSSSTAEAAFGPYPRIERISWRSPSGGTMMIYQRGLSTAPASGSPSKYQIWLRDMSGKPGELQMELSLPDPP